jgi:hypothetical protein
VVRRCEQLDLTNGFQAAMQENLLRRSVAWIGIGADRFETEGPEPVINNGCDRFTGVSVCPMGLT